MPHRKIATAGRMHRCLATAAIRSVAAASGAEGTRIFVTNQRTAPNRPASSDNADPPGPHRLPAEPFIALGQKRTWVNVASRSSSFWRAIQWQSWRVGK